MDVERYPGERRGLSLFLSELLPAVERVLGRDCLLYHRVRRAQAPGDLAGLRAARQMFNSQPREVKQALSVAMYAAAEPAPSQSDLLDRYSERRPAPFVRFEVALDPHGDAANGKVALAHELLDPAALQVLVRPDSLPTVVADSLRRLADRIERDRRLLSSRYWQGTRDGALPFPTGSDSADRA
jgi:hypothetical protein